MKTNNRLNTRFGPETRFELKPAVAPFRVTEETELERLKNRLLNEALAKTEDVQLNTPLRRAANEAAAVAWVSRFPLLLFPALFEEKVRAARLQLQKQRQVRARSQAIFAEAA
ncbi:MAG: hypothetical protein H0X66_21730 [Verrucomicrobia bacterium]|nr:hypothetical protein [Verrucomicrobiota bacterium]